MGFLSKGSDDNRGLRERYASFTWTKPVGYKFSEVEDAMNRYKSTINDINEYIMKLQDQIESLKAENQRLVREVTNAQMQMESVLVPPMSDREALDIVEDFSDRDLSCMLSEEDSEEVDKTLSHVDEMADQDSERAVSKKSDSNKVKMSSEDNNSSGSNNNNFHLQILG